MGIKNGAPDIISILKHGVYNRTAPSYKIMVDGELMRYKGMVESNLTKHNVEEAIAATSYDYMNKTINAIIQLVGRIPAEVIVYMDGVRVANKETCRADFRFDASLIRTVFKEICKEHGHTVIELQHGESELQMYLKRDKSSPLNIFLTNDSDMISICYGHRPTSLTNKFQTIDNDQYRKKQTELQEKCVIDNNLDYANPDDIVDSCAWINCARNGITAIGFDFVETRNVYTPDVFRVFVSLCGTDFTNSLLTASMITGILTSEIADRQFINSLTDVNHIAACFQMLGIRAGGVIKRFTPLANEERYANYDVNTGERSSVFDVNELVRSINMYRDYISSGLMSNLRIPRPNMSIVCRQYLYAMRAQDDNFVKKNLMTWAQMTSLQEAVENLKKYHGTYNMFDAAIKNRKSTSNKTQSPKKRSNAVLTEFNIPINEQATIHHYDYNNNNTMPIAGIESDGISESVNSEPCSKIRIIDNGPTTTTTTTSI